MLRKSYQIQLNNLFIIAGSFSASQWYVLIA